MRGLLNADQAAARLGISRARIYALVRAGILQPVRLGRQIRLDPVALERLIAGGWRRVAPEKGNRTVERIDVKYGGGPSRHSEAAVDYMIAQYGNTELYAEVTPDERSEIVTFDALRTAIIDQAAEKGISRDRLRFWFDE